MNDAPGWLGPASSRGVCHETHAQTDPHMQPSVKGHPDQNQAICIFTAGKPARTEPRGIGDLAAGRPEIG
jgi:hypothetical protein